MIFKKNTRKILRPSGSLPFMATWGSFVCCLLVWSVAGFFWAKFLVFHAEYTKSVIDLRPEDVAQESGILGDRSKSVPGLSADMVSTLKFPLATLLKF